MPEEEIHGQGQDSKEEVTLDSIRKQCLDSQGYVLFAAVISNERDDKGFNLIDFKYRRSNFSFEDTRNAIKEFIKAYEKDAGITNV